MKKIIMFTILILSFISCSSNPKFKIVLSESEKIYMSNIEDFCRINPEYDSIKIRENKINSMTQYTFEIGLWTWESGQTYEKTIDNVYTYDNKGVILKHIFYNNGYSEDEIDYSNINKSGKLIVDSTWNKNTLKIVSILDSSTLVLENEYIVFNNIGYLKSTKSTQTIKGKIIYKMYINFNKNSYTSSYTYDKKTKKSTTDWIKDKNGNISEYNITSQTGEIKSFNIEYDDNNRIVRIVKKETSGEVKETIFRYDNLKRICEKIEIENDGYNWFSIEKVYYNSLGLISNIDNYMIDKPYYIPYLENKISKDKITKVEANCIEYKWFTKKSPFEPVK